MKRRDIFRHGISIVPLLVSGIPFMSSKILFEENQSVLSENGFVPLFDGKTLNGWHTTPRVYVPSREPRFAYIPPEDLKAAVIQYYEQNPDPAEKAKAHENGVWKIEDGAITGGQTPNSKRGAYLLTNKKYGDFELTLEAKPDWPVDTGIMVRAHELGSVGFQVLLDHRPGGAIGGVYGNSTGNFRAYPFVLDGNQHDGFRVANLRATVTDKQSFKPDYSATADEFLAVWKANDWNTFRIKCSGRLPLIEIWINGTLISKLDTAKLADRVPGYDPEAIFKRIGRTGYIGFEVHDNDAMGYNRWAPGAVCRWKNISLKET
jgi:hypothetical protein